MSRRYFNWKLAVVLLIGLFIIGIAAYTLRQWQRGRRADMGLLRGNEAYSRKDWAEAAKHMGRHIAVRGNDVPVLLKYADAQLKIRPLKRNNIRQAVAAYRSVLRIEKNNSEAALRLTGMYIVMNMPGEAELIAARQLADHPTRLPELCRIWTIALAKQRKFDQAQKNLEILIKQHPKYVPAYETLGQLIEQHHDEFSGKAANFFDLAVTNNPSSALAYIVRGAFFLRNNEPIRALDDLEQAEKFDISDISLRLRLARELINANALDKAEMHLIAVRTDEPGNLELWRIWAQLALKSQSKTRMNETAETALEELASERWDFMLLAAELFIQTGNYQRATDCINQLQKEDMHPALCAFLEGLVADGRGQAYKAVESWARAIHLGNKSPRIRLKMASTLTRLGNTQSALGQLRTLVSERPNFFDGRLALAKLLAQIGNWAETAVQAHIACQIAPNRADAKIILCKARIQLLDENSISNDSPDWKDIEQKIATLNKTSGGDLEVGFLKFQILMKKGDLIAAEQLLEELKSSHSPQIKLAITEADLFVARQEKEHAAAVINGAILQFPKEPELVRYLAILLARQGDYNGAREVLELALERINQPFARRQLGLLLAQVHLLSKDQEKAYTFLEGLAQELPNDIPIKRELLKFRQITSENHRAQKLVDDIKSLQGEQSWQWRYEQAKLWCTPDNFDDHYPQTVSLLKENLLADPYNQANRMLLALAYSRAGELQLAVSTYQQALDRSPRDIRVIIPTVAALHRVNEYDRADEILRRIAGEKIFSPQLQKLQLQSHLRRGELDSAGNILENLFAEDPNNSSVCLSLALLKMQQDQFDEADRLLGILKAHEPNSPQIAALQIGLNIRQGKSAEALLLCDELVKSNNNASAYIMRAQTYAAFANKDKAQQDFDRAAAIEPNNVDVWVARSVFYRNTGRLDKAMNEIQNALLLAPENIQIQKRAIQVFIESAKPQRLRQARNIITQALEAHPENIQLKFLKARMLTIQGTAPALEEAVRILRKINEDQPENVDAWLLLGEIMLTRQQPTQAMDAALRGLVQTSDNKGLLLLKAKAEAARSPVLPIPTLKALHELIPGDVEVLLLLAQTYIAADSPEKASSLLNEHLAKFTDTADERKIRLSLAVALYKNKNKDQAQQEFDRLYQSAPDEPEVLLVHARVLADEKLWSQLGEIVQNWCSRNPQDTNTPVAVAAELATTQGSGASKTAEIILRSVLDREGNCLPAMNVFAMLLQITGRPEKAAELYEQILTRQPDNVVVINNLAWILCKEQNKPQQALDLTQRALKIAPDYVDLLDTQGVIYLCLGEFDKASQVFTRCLRLYLDSTPASVASRFHLGKAFASLGQKEKAADSLKKALDQNSKIGGLSPADVHEAERLISELLEGT